ncbi:MAG: hypothetical protein KAX55_04570 [Propionivibrio sp.]|jgi:hypothetical protein|nr:hypothetical protein [Propionivibrio sp.]
MKKHAPLSPAIEEIEQRLLGISDGLLEAVERGEASPGIAETVRRSPEWHEYQVRIEEERETAQESAADARPLAMPEHIGDAIRRRVAARSLSKTPIPTPGQIVSIAKIITPRSGQLDAIMTAPLYVLLDAPTDAPALWHGWLVAGETEYAGWWDFVLQEEDAPFDPDAAMVQLWNPVHLYLPMAGKVVGCLAAHRLQAVRSLAADFVTSEAPKDVPVWPGRVAMRLTTSSLPVATGSPLGSSSDPRHRYQDVYFEAAEAIREPARLALREMTTLPSTQAGVLLSRLIAAAGRIAEVLLPEPRVAVAMNAEDQADTPDLIWPGIARFRLLELDEAGISRIEVTAIGAEPVTVEVMQGSLVEDHVKIMQGSVGTLSWDKDSTALVLSTMVDRRLELSLTGM